VVVKESFNFDAAQHEITNQQSARQGLTVQAELSLKRHSETAPHIAK
jgi:hypothetical protein